MQRNTNKMGSDEIYSEILDVLYDPTDLKYNYKSYNKENLENMSIYRILQYFVNHIYSCLHLLSYFRRTYLLYFYNLFIHNCWRVYGMLGCNLLSECARYSGISLRRTHHKADTLYKADRDFGPILYFSGQTLIKVISIKRTLP